VLADDVKPDGLATDADGCLWIAVWDGWRVERYAPDGRCVKTIKLPVPRPTSLAFGGKDLATLYVTSARARLDPESLESAPLSGALFAVEAGVRGLAVAPFGG
jgi:sugar lactone lactonase YvrE